MNVQTETDYNTLNNSGRSGQAHLPSLLATVLTPPFLASAWSIKVQQGNRSSEWVTPAAHGKGTPSADMSWHNVTLAPLLHLFHRKGLFQHQTLTFLDALLSKTAVKLCLSLHWINATSTTIKGPSNKAIDLLIRDAIWLQFQTNCKITSTVNNIHYFLLSSMLACPKSKANTPRTRSWK